ncbi:MAG: Re/Si-specific NAD(P)(+) transhydrogenase subunit alpha [Burkholderiales bacterium]
MPLKIAVPTERLAGETRIAMTPEVAKKLKGLGAVVCLETDAGSNSHYPDMQFSDATFAPSASETCRDAQIVLKVQPPTADEVNLIPADAVLVTYLAPGRNTELAKQLRDRNITSLSMELVPRISRAQSMDSLSSQASVSGYQAALMAAQLSPRFFPMLTTAAGTIRPAKVLVIGAGVAGLQAIATARRLGAMIDAYDVRAAAKEQVESLGAKFVTAISGAEGSGGYARELTEEEKQQQQEVLAKVVASADAVICTAAIPGRPAPKIVSAAMVGRMKPGAVIVDLAAETGGNCELTEPGKTIRTANGVLIHGPLNVPATMPIHASEMYAKNLFNLLSPFIKDGAFKLDLDDDVIKGCLYTHAGKIVHEPTRQLVEGA